MGAHRRDDPGLRGGARRDVDHSAKVTPSALTVNPDPRVPVGADGFWMPLLCTLEGGGFERGAHFPSVRPGRKDQLARVDASYAPMVYPFPRSARVSPEKKGPVATGGSG